MEWIIRIGQFLLSLSVLIILHELGHFIPAKLFKTRVEKFFLFFDYRFALFKKKIGDTIWGVGWIPLGGYVKIAGMVDESMDKAQLQQPPQPWEYRSKKAWQRLIIILGGITVNIILAIVIFIMMAWQFSEVYLTSEAVKDGIFVVNEEVGNYIGLKNGDKILSIGGKKIQNFSELNKELIYSGGEIIEIVRAGEKLFLDAPKDVDQVIMKSGNPEVVALRMPFYVGGFSDSIPFAREAGFQIKDLIIGLDSIPVKYFDEFRSLVKQKAGQEITVKILRNNDTLQLRCRVSERGQIGAVLGTMSLQDLDKLGIYKVEKKRYSLAEAIPHGFKMAFGILGEYIRQFKLIFTSEGVKQVGSLGTMLKMFPTTWDWQAFWRLTAFLSIILAFVNLLPIPALDGGHAVFIVYELITGRKPSDKFLERAQTIGMVILLALMVYALGNDILKAFQGRLF